MEAALGASATSEGQQDQIGAPANGGLNLADVLMDVTMPVSVSWAAPRCT